jgi:hypothetical protein
MGSTRNVPHSYYINNSPWQAYIFHNITGVTYYQVIRKNLGSPVLHPPKQLESNESEFEGCWGAKNPTPDSSNCTTESRVAPQPYPWPKLSNRLLDSSSVPKMNLIDCINTLNINI